MAYNKARAEKKWLKWKEAEEKKLRELGVDEETIQRLHTYDWAEFTGPNSTGSAGTCSGRWSGRPMWIWFRRRTWNCP